MILIIGGFGEERNGYAAEHYPGYEILRDYQLIVKKQIQEGKNPQEEAENLLTGIPDRAVVTTVEMGCGVVPTDAFERTYREENGRVNCILAAHADEVIRLVCGIGTRIK